MLRSLKTEVDRSVYIDDLILVDKSVYVNDDRLPASYNGQMSQQPRKDQLLQTAFELFNRQGYHATGIDQILAESGVAKATLYKYFPSKEDLILAVLERRHQQLSALMQSNLEDKIGFERVYAVFESFDAWFHSEDFQGCNYIHASAEYADAGHPIHLYAAEHKRWLKTLLQASLTAQPPDLPEAVAETLAEQLLMLLDGATVAAQLRGRLTAARLARQAAEALLTLVSSGR
jgi:AcrR family transcriptional regulator